MLSATGVYVTVVDELPAGTVTDDAPLKSLPSVADPVL